ncbi:MAG: hypothetical protein ACLQD9_08820 [Thermoplasmata archaeon]
MHPTDLRSAPVDWKSAVTVRDDSALSRELVERLRHIGTVRGLSVSDLVAPRRAFWRRLAPPLPMSPEREESMAQGRSWHRAAGRLFSAEGALEVRLRREGISCRIDLLADVPVEIKTGGGPLPADLPTERPEHIEQLAMYCALLERPNGRLVHIAVEEGRPTGVGATDVTFRDLSKVHGEMRAREAVLRRAIDRKEPVALPRCRWFGRGCEFQLAGACDCRGEEVRESAVILEEVRSTTERPDISARWLAALIQSSTVPTSSGLDRFRELVYPRRAFFDRSRTVGAAPAAPSAPAARVPDLYDRLLETTESGPVGEVLQLPSAANAPEEEVVGFRGAPLLLRTSKAWSRVQPSDAVTRFPQYALDLGFRCAATGTSVGRVVLGYEHAEEDADRLQVLEFRFDPIDVLARLAEDRARRISAALADASPRGLEPCAAWMFGDCPYKVDCACGADASRSQR